MRRTFLAAAVATALLTTQNVHALGLGEADVQSFLNQPLQVRIPIVTESEDERRSLQVTLASAEDFRRVGLDRSALGSRLNVTVDDGPNGLVVKLSSDSPIRDPFLQVLLSADWSSGRMLRQYTLFLDPPLLETPSIQVQAEPETGGSARQAPAPTSRPRPASTSGSGTRSTPSIQGDAYGPVSAGETLWSIASRTNPNASDYSINQVMLAYVRLNPEAFDRGNVNSLRRGATLRIPDADDIAVVNPQEALRMVQQQHQRWRDSGFNFSSGSDDSGAGGGRSGSRGDDDSAAAIPDGRLQLVPPEASSGDASDVAGMQAELARLEEELLTARLENSDLADQVQELRDEIARLEDSGVQDRDLAQFEDYLGNQPAEDDAGDEAYVDPFVNDGFADDGSQDEAESDAMGDDTGESADTSLASTDTSAQAAENNGAQVPQDNTPPTVAMDTPPINPADQQSESGGSWFSPLTLVIALLGGLGVFFLMWMQRRRDTQGEGTRKSELSGKKRFGRKEKAKDKGASGGSLAERLVKSKKTAAGGAGLAGMTAAQPAPSPEVEQDEPPPPVQRNDDAVEQSRFDDAAFDAPLRDTSETTETTAAPAPEPETADEDDGLDFNLGSDSDSDSGGDQDGDSATEDLLRRLAADDDMDSQDSAASKSDASGDEESGLDFDLSGMEHLLSDDEAGADANADAQAREEEDAYASVLRMAAEDDEADTDDSGDNDSLAGPDEDEVEIKLDLARAYISMGDSDAAATILDEILSEGSEVQRAEARNLLKQI
ncbi:MAG: hypothetical protein Tsb002_22920 [Wenzhouxiangellaceae bacterium]